MNFLKSFKYAFEGLMYMIKFERNFRFHLCAGLSAILLSFNYDLSGTKKLILAFTITFVIICEMLNTAVECAVNLSSPEYSQLAKIAKDVSAGAVLVSAFIAIASAFVLFYDARIFWNIVLNYIKNPLFWIYTALCITFIHGGILKLITKGERF